MPCFKYNFYSFYSSFEKLLGSIRYFPVYRGSFSDVVRDLRTLAHFTFYTKPKCRIHPIFNNDDFNILKKLSARRDLVVCSPDKGRGVVLLNLADYN